MSNLGSLDKEVIRQAMKEVLAGVKPLLNVALLFASLTLVVLIIQSLLIAKLFSHLVLFTLHQETFPSAFLHNSLIALFFLFIARPLCEYLRAFFSDQASFRARQSLYNKLLQKLSALGPESRFFGSVGALSTHLMDEVDALDGFISRYYVQMILVLLTPLFIIGVVTFYSTVAAIIFFLTIPLIIVFMILVGGSAADKSREQFAALSRLSASFLELVRGIKTIQRFHSQKKVAYLIEKNAESYRKKTLEILRLAFLSIGTLEFFSSLAIAAIALYLGLSLMRIFPGFEGKILVPYEGALLILILAPEFYTPLRQLGADYHAKATAEGAIRELLPLLNYKPLEEDQEAIKILEGPPFIEAVALALKGKNGNYRLKPVSFSLKAGERAWVRGVSGAGKSSLLECFLKFVSFEGQLYINDLPLRLYQRAAWFSKIAYLAQSPSVLSGTIAENLRLVKSNATDEELIKVLAKVELDELVAHLPLGLETPLGERGQGLSGGQLSRLSIAQLLLQDACFWLIDEPTEHLDADTAEAIISLLERLTRGSTVLWVSHQRKALDWVDKSIWVNS